MQILVTGDKGYIGTALCKQLNDLKYDLVGLDIDLYDDFVKTKRNYKRIKKDIRNIDLKDLKGIDCVIHLAAISNDPLGELSGKITYDINYKATVKLAKLAKKSSVETFIYISTQSVYGISSNISKEIKEDTKNIKPLTAYAKSKYKAEKVLLKLASKSFKMIVFRPATVFGESNNFRSDIVLNNLLGNAYLTNSINIFSDGKPWRPILHIDDMVNIIIASIKKAKKLNKEIINLGYPKKNYTVLNLANFIKKVIPSSNVAILNSKKDQRTYKVNFDKVYKYFKDDINFNIDIVLRLKKLLTFYKKYKLSNKNFNGRKTIRLLQLRHLIEKKKFK
jgi:nucleoside-diphosphate-sugar epimerase